MSDVEAYNYYYTEAGNFKDLSVEEELELVRAAKVGDQQAMKTLLFYNLPLIKYIIKEMSAHLVISIDDLVQEGNIAFMKAVYAYDEEKSNGARIGGYAYARIKAAINEYRLNNIKAVRSFASKTKRKAFFNLPKYNRQGKLNELQLIAVAEELDIPVSDLREAQDSLCYRDSEFTERNPNKIAFGDDNSYYTTPEYAIDHDNNPADLFMSYSTSKKVRDAIDTLDERSRDIIHSRWLNDEEKPVRRNVLAKKYGITQQRVEQIEKNAMKNMRSSLLYA